MSLRLDGIAAPLPCDVYRWPEGRSYTGQQVAEIHTFGSPPLLEVALRTLVAAGARLAEPGEFTLRAFLAGRIDLTQAEAVLGVIDAATPGELSVALGQLAGNLARPLDALRSRLLDLLAHLEAGFDFADEDLPFIAPEELDRQLGEAAEIAAGVVGQMECRGTTTEGIRAVFTGLPNSGKSSLFNALAGQSALVSHHPGTTRDYLTAEVDLGGLRCQLVDTAGVHGSDIGDAAETLAHEQRNQAHVLLWCLDATRPLDAWQQAQLVNQSIPGRIIVITKCDLGRLWLRSESSPILHTSSLTGEGLDRLRDAVRTASLAATTRHGDVVAGTAARCRQSLQRAAESLVRARAVLEAGDGEELVAAEIRLALDELGRVVGAVYTEDVLERVFRRFCIGK